MVDIPSLRDAYRTHKLRAVRPAAQRARADAQRPHGAAPARGAGRRDAAAPCGPTPASAASFALVAVGGFGRGELFPHSDVDVLLLLPDGDAADRRSSPARIEAFIGHCWDAGLEIGSSVRTVDECLAEAAKDVTVQTSLLESRLVTGDKKLYAAFRKRFLAADRPAGLLRRQDAGDAPPPPRSSRTRPTRSSPTARNRPAACATCRSSCG